MSKRNTARKGTKMNIAMIPPQEAPAETPSDTKQPAQVVTEPEVKKSKKKVAKPASAPAEVKTEENPSQSDPKPAKKTRGGKKKQKEETSIETTGNEGTGSAERPIRYANECVVLYDLIQLLKSRLDPKPENAVTQGDESDAKPSTSGTQVMQGAPQKTKGKRKATSVTDSERPKKTLAKEESKGSSDSMTETPVKFKTKSKTKAPPKVKVEKAPNRSILDLKIFLEEISPPIWRRILVLNNDTFADLHNYIQEAMGWKSCHLHRFSVKNATTGKEKAIVDLLTYFEAEPGSLDSKTTKLSRFLNQKGDTVYYEYDFGDSWCHKIVVHGVLPPPPPKAEYPKIKGGQRACPPEDCGGVPGYYHLLDVYKNPQHEEYQDLIVDWLGDLAPGWDPEKFEKKRIFKKVWMWLPG